MDLADVAAKVANQSRLTPAELDFWKNAMRETQQRNSFVSGVTTPMSTLDVKFPFAPIYSEVLAVDTASISVQIPQDYKHLFVIGSGRNSTAGTGNRAVWCQMNGDTGANYSEQYIRGAGATASAAELLGHTAGLHLGVYAEASHAAGIAGSFFTFLPHYKSNLFKAALSLSIGPTATGYSNTYFSEFWLSTAPITSMYIYSSAGNFVAGSVLSLYGIL